ncbi:MAG: VTT domain-containing protein [Chloroflexi bacterium]|jgi:membrane protein YqaA with SNARE-associated domain|nr:VTT domain-containing protein [Chloroflexota bacterium]BCY18287.1 DedA family protein [Leptolinea sp. HRD-7]
MTNEKKDRLLRIAIIAGAILFTGILIYNREQIKNFGSLGYPGIFLVAFLSSATVFVPLPGIMFTTAMGAVFNPLWVAIAAGTGAGLGEMSGYLVGFSGRELVNKTAWHEKVEGWIRRYGIWIIILLSSIPNPAFDFVGFTAGVLKLPVWEFVLGTIIGNIIKMLVFAYGGAGVFSFFPIAQ